MISKSRASNDECCSTRQHGPPPLQIEYQWVGTADDASPLIVFPHEGPRLVAMWRDFPCPLVCEAAGARGLVYSRPGYGRSTPRPHGEKWGVDFMHRRLARCCPRCSLRSASRGNRQTPWLFGHIATAAPSR